MTSTNFDIDQITLEYFTNRQTYNKYLAKTNPDEGKKQLYESIETHKEILQELFSQLLDNANQECFRNMLPKYESFMEECVSYVLNEKEKEEEEALENTRENENDCDTMFHKCENLNIKPSNPIEFWKTEQVLKTKI